MAGSSHILSTHKLKLWRHLPGDLGVWNNPQKSLGALPREILLNQVKYVLRLFIDLKY